MEMFESDFEAIRNFLYQETGIALGEAKRDMVTSRLARRLRHFGLNSLGEYLKRVIAGEPKDEKQHFINCLTTNKTDFFREPHHFDYLRDTLIPRFHAEGKQKIRIWSAGCSTGEEPYTLAMMLREHCPPKQGWDVRILASDIDTGVLATAKAGIYEADRATDIPGDLLHRWFLRGTGLQAGKIAARPELRDMITFRQINLIHGPWPIQAKFDAIFCRNVVIYFDRPTQAKLLTRFASHLHDDGYLFMGHSENIHWMSETFTPLGGTIYRLRDSVDTPLPARVVPPSKPSVAALAKPEVAKETSHTIILGDVKATSEPSLLKTLLGSCVSACIYDPKSGIGGMNHFSLPGTSDSGTSASYGAHAMELLITAVMKLGGDRSRFRAKVFGGAKVLKFNSEHLNVGAKNAEFVLKYLETEEIPVDAQCLGGTQGLLVRFQPHLGKAFAKPLASREMPAVVRSEEQFGRELLERVSSPAVDDGITLF